MGRANRISCSSLVWHVTHRCHKKEFLLKFAKDRRRWRHWLYEAKRRYGLCVLDYIATSNHVHLLLYDQGCKEISLAMQLLASRTAQEFNIRKGRHGAFWEDRFHATAVQTDNHLARCIAYIDLNMVRANAVLHPRDWEVSGFHEIQRPKQRKGIVDHDALCNLLNIKSQQELKQMHMDWVENELCGSTHEPIWTQAAAVGDKAFLAGLLEDLGPENSRRRILDKGGQSFLREEPNAYFAFWGQKTPD